MSSDCSPSSAPEAVFTPDAALLRADVAALAGRRVLILGDVMLDHYLTGSAERISPEAPVPVVRIEREELLVGGAGNVARNIVSLGGSALLLGVRGKDGPGRDLERCMLREGIEERLLVLPQRPTTVKTRVLAQRQQVVRFDREQTDALSAPATDALLAAVADALPECGAVVLSDYGKGLVSDRMTAGLRKLIAADGRDIPLLVDPKPCNFSFYAGVTLLTPNAKETSESVSLPVRTPAEIVHAGRAILSFLGSRHLVTTLGAQGMAVFEDADHIWHIPTTAIQVFDVTGAGDTVISALALGAAAGLPLVRSCLLANYAAGIVVGRVGAAAATPPQLAEAIAALPPPEVRQWASPDGVFAPAAFA